MSKNLTEYKRSEHKTQSRHSCNVEGSNVVTKSSLKNVNGNAFVPSKDLLCDTNGGDKLNHNWIFTRE